MVAHYLGVVGVAGSNPVVPKIFYCILFIIDDRTSPERSLDFLSLRKKSTLRILYSYGSKFRLRLKHVPKIFYCILFIIDDRIIINYINSRCLDPKTPKEERKLSFRCFLVSSVQQNKLIKKSLLIS